MESSDVMPPPITRRPLEESVELAALRGPVERDGPDALRAFPPVDLLLDLLPELRDRLLELPFPLLPLVPPLLRFGIVDPRVEDAGSPRARCVPLRCAEMAGAQPLVSFKALFEHSRVAR